MLEYDCAIVGAGFVGATLAIALSRSGYRVVVIDSRSQLSAVNSEDARGIALSPSSVEIFEHLDLWSGLAERATPITKIKVSEQGAFASVDLSAEEFGLSVLAQVVPADHLLRTIEGHMLGECKVLWRTRLERFDLADNRVAITVRDETEAEHQLVVKLLIGADGVRSKVRRLSGISTQSRPYNQSAVVATVASDGIEPGLAIERFTANGPLAVLPLAEKRHVVVRCCLEQDTEALMALSDEEFLADLACRLGRPVGNFSNPSARRNHALVLSQAESLIAERVALVGAAAVTIHPNAAQGLNLGLRDLVELSVCLAPDGDADLHNLGNDNQLNQYASRRREDHKRIIKLTDTLARGFSSDLFGLRPLRRFGLLLGKLSPSLRRLIIQQGVGLGRTRALPFAKHPSAMDAT
ncbi:MAG: FAD-dependent oxidoreductase [Pseudomonadota bacterium]